MMTLPQMTAQEAAALVQNGDTIGVGGFGPPGTPKTVTAAIAEKALVEHAAGREFRIRVLASSSVGPSCDTALAEAKAMAFRLPFSVNKTVRKAANEGEIDYLDINLSDNAPQMRLGLTGQVTWSIIEACHIEEVGEKVRVYLTAAVGIAPTLSHVAEKGVFIELNHWHSPDIIGIHDVYEVEMPWQRKPILVTSVESRIGKPYIEMDRKNVRGVIECNLPDEARSMTPANETTQQMGRNVADFLVWNMKKGLLDPNNLVLQSGVGSGANAVLGALADNKDVPDFKIYTEVFQDEPLRLLCEGRAKAVSTGALSVSPEHLRDLYNNIDKYRDRLVVRPSEVSNNIEVIARLGVCALNTALEADIYGHINSTKVCGTQMMNGVGGSCDFTTSAALTIFTCGSTTKDGKISSIVPFCSHVDHTEHFVDAVITEYGVADLRGLTARGRVDAMISIAHPDYRPILQEYKRLAFERGGHTPHIISAAFAMHDTYLRKGDMRLVDWNEYILK